MGKCPQSISSILMHQEYNSFLPATLNLSKDFSYTLGEEGREKDWRMALPRRGAGDGTAHKAVGSRATEAQTSPLASLLIRFFQKPNLLGDHDKDTIRTIKRLLLPFFSLFIFSFPSSHSPHLFQMSCITTSHTAYTPTRQPQAWMPSAQRRKGSRH